MLVSGAGLSGAAPDIQTVDAGGHLHRHLASKLNFTDGSNKNPPNAPEGIYLVGLQLKLPGSGLANSDLFYIVYNGFVVDAEGNGEDLHDEAMAWVEVNLVPEPSTWLLAMTGVVAIGACCRKKRGGPDRKRFSGNMR